MFLYLEEVACHVSGGGDAALLDEVLQVVAKYILPLPSGVPELSLPLTFCNVCSIYVRCVIGYNIINVGTVVQRENRKNGRVMRG